MKTKLLLLCLLVCLGQASFSASVTISGPTTVCPGVAYNYTASASTILGPRNGCFQWTFSVNGVAVGYSGTFICPCGIDSSTSTVAFTWPQTGNAQISIRFLAKNDPTCNFPIPNYSFGTYNVWSRVIAPSGVYDAQGGLSFCSSGQTRTIMVPVVVYNDPNYCNWHHAYDWIVPTGWTLTPTNQNELFQTISGGIRTHATSVNVTSPATALLQGFTGNYFITVSTEPAWPWPKQISRQIWVGTYDGNLSISGQSAVCPGNTYTYEATPPGGQQMGGLSYQWTKPSNWSIQSQSANYLTVYVPQYNPDYGVVQVSVNNGCGVSANGLTVFPGYGCGGYYAISIYPNPATEELTVEMRAENNVDALSSESPKIDEVLLVNSESEKVKSSVQSANKYKFDLRGLKKGRYFINVRMGKEIVKEQVVIN